MEVLKTLEALADVMVFVFKYNPMNERPFNHQRPNPKQPRQKVARANCQVLDDSSRWPPGMRQQKKCTVRVHKSRVSETSSRWDGIDIPPVERSVYQEPVTMAQQSELEVSAYPVENEILVGGCDVPKPMLILEEASLPICLRDYLETNCHTITSIQAQCRPIAFHGRDRLAVIQAGTKAKAIAYLVPAVVHLVSKPFSKYGDTPIALFVVANREAAREVHELACEIEEYTKVEDACLSNGDPKQPQLQELEKRPPICMATLARLLPLLEERQAGPDPLHVRGV
ncbi:hypothetical protein MTO96_015728 [Rhipicephalus appendiculatus]